MVPEVLLTIDIVPLDQTMDEKVLLELIAPCLNRLKALKGSFDAILTYSPLSVNTHKKMEVRN